MGGVRLFPETFMTQVGKPKLVIPRVKGGHEADFLNAIRTGEKSSADFDYSPRASPKSCSSATSPIWSAKN